METLESIYASNLQALRKDRHLTQLELAEKLGYSDNLSGAESTTQDIAAFFGVSLDTMLKENGAKGVLDKAPDGAKRKANQITIIAMVACFIFFGAAAIFAYNMISAETPDPNLWIVFLWAIPVTSLVSTFLSWRFYKISLPFWIFLSVTIWTAFIVLPLHFHLYYGQEIWYVILVPIPLQIGILLGMRLQ